jgi:hypothetical protein
MSDQVLGCDDFNGIALDPAKYPDPAKSPEIVNKRRVCEWHVSGEGATNVLDRSNPWHVIPIYIWSRDLGNLECRRWACSSGQDRGTKWHDCQQIPAPVHWCTEAGENRGGSGSVQMTASLVGSSRGLGPASSSSACTVCSPKSPVISMSHVGKPGSKI